MKTQIITFIICFLMILSQKDLSSQSSYSDQVDKLISQIVDSTTAGMAIGVIKDNKLIFKKCYGLANIEYNISITLSTIFEIASISKQFTAFSILLLEKDGKLSTLDKINKYIPELPECYNEITIENLVYHTSGIKDQFDLLRIAGWRRDDIVTQVQVLNLIANQQSLNFQPGEDRWYCNSGYTLLAEIIERVSGKSLEEFMSERIFEPLEMNNTFVHDDNDMIVKNRATSYRPDGFGKYKIEQYNYSTYGAMGIYTNILDFAKWDKNFYTGKVGGKETILKMKKKCILNNGKEEDYGYGINIDDYNGLPTILHGGSEAGYYSRYIQFPSEKLSIIILSNMGIFDAKLHYKIADIYLDLPREWEIKTCHKLADASYLKDESLGMYFGGLIFSFVKENNKLLVEFRDNYKIELYEESEGIYYTINPPYKFSFIKDSLESINQFLLNDKYKYSKIENVKLDKRELSQYSGEYYSEELKVIRHIIVKDGLLYVIGRNESKDPLFYYDKDIFYETNTDEFNVGMVEIKFQRNQNGDIGSFRIDGYATKNILFKKVKNIQYMSK